MMGFDSLSLSSLNGRPLFGLAGALGCVDLGSVCTHSDWPGGIMEAL